MPINALSVQTVDNAYFDKDFCKPLYDSYCFSRIPQTLHTCFTGLTPELGLPTDVRGGESDGVDFIVLFFLDGFGYHFFEQHLSHAPFLQRCVKDGIVSKITSQFPSTTTPHVTCLNTGLEVGQSGLYEWFMYEPTLERMIAPLICSYAGDKVPGTLQKAGVDVATLYPRHTLYHDFNKLKIQSFALQPFNISDSPYSNAMFQGARYFPFHHFADALDTVVDLYQNKPEGEKRYVYVYLGDIDAIGHRSGPSSPEFSQSIQQTLTLLEERFFGRLTPKTGVKARCLITADHGMTEISPKDIFYINRAIPQFEQYIAVNSHGDYLVPAGSCRDFFLHIRPEQLDSVKEIVANWMGERALVAKTSELIADGFFGSLPPSELFLQRVGNLVVLPRDRHAVWWYEKHKFEQHFYGMHGGLSRIEMEIPFLYLPI